MKNFKVLLVLIASALILSSCSNNYLVDGQSKINPERETTIEILNQIDTTRTYYVVIGKNDILYVINTQNQLVEYKINDNSGALLTCIILIFILFVFLLFTINQMS